jgi:hypothetical protein
MALNMVKEFRIEMKYSNFPINMEQEAQIKAYLSKEQSAKNGVLVSVYYNPKDNSVVYGTYSQSNI